jgi:hypothetical protein
MRKSKEIFVCKEDCIKLASQMNDALSGAIAELGRDLKKGDEISQQIAYCYIKTLFDFTKHKAPEIVKRIMEGLYKPEKLH